MRMKTKTRREVVVRFTSGLGNQLFQLACGLHLAGKEAAQLVADTTWYDFVAQVHRPVRSFRLPELGVFLPQAFRGPRRWAVGLTTAIFDRWQLGRGLCEKIGSMHISQETAPMTSQMLSTDPNRSRTYLNGYWQTADHFLAVRDVLDGILDTRVPLSAGATEWTARIEQQKTAFIHIRRGDYQTLAGHNGILPLEYYKKAVRALRDRGESWHWLVFSEDKDWASRNLGFLDGWELVSYESRNRDIEDLLLMKRCSAGIIANSSFSWWGAALGDKPGRPIAAPGKYWRHSTSGSEDWRLPDWLPIPAWE